MLPADQRNKTARARLLGKYLCQIRIRGKGQTREQLGAMVESLVMVMSCDMVMVNANLYSANSETRQRCFRPNAMKPRWNKIVFKRWQELKVGKRAWELRSNPKFRFVNSLDSLEQIYKSEMNIISKSFNVVRDPNLKVENQFDFSRPVKPISIRRRSKYVRPKLKQHRC